MKARIDVLGLAEMIATLSGATDRLKQAQGGAAFRAGERMVNEVRFTYRNAAETTPSATAARTGRLRDSYGQSVTVDRAVTLEVGTIKPETASDVLTYAWTHEYGATIRPKNGKALTIPIGPMSNDRTSNMGRGYSARTASGVQRGSARDMDLFKIVVAGGKRGVGPYRSTKSGHPILFQKQGDKVVPMFMLVSQVKVPARPALQPAADKVWPSFAADLVESSRAAVMGQA
jgi:hypothetical protein